MANLTLTIDADILRAARIRALEQGTSVNALVREYLRAYVEPRDARGILERSFDRADRSGASSGSGGRRWKREDLYDRWERSRRS